jgi:hypothetical protein
VPHCRQVPTAVTVWAPRQAITCIDYVEQSAAEPKLVLTVVLRSLCTAAVIAERLPCYWLVL